MKKSLYRVVAIATACILMYGCSQVSENEFILKGNISDYSGDKVYLSIGGVMEEPLLDSVIVKDGKFEYRGNIEEPQRVTITDKKSSFSGYDPNTKAVSFYIEPGVMSLKMEWFAPDENMRNTLKEYTLEGSESDTENRILDKMMKEAKDKYLDSITSFINKYPGSYISAITLDSYESLFTLEQLKNNYALLTQEAKNYTPGKNIEETIVKREAVMPGKPAPQFSRRDINGNTINISDFRGKVVLVDFWASWCKPCRASMPHIKELYKKYHKKGFEVLCIADNDGDEKIWKDAIQADGTGDFIHLLRGLIITDYGFDRSNDLSELFTVHSLPTKFLIGEDGNFILTFASDEELDKKLKEIYGF